MDGEFNFPGEKSTWNGFECFNFELEKIPCVIVIPEKIHDGNPWLLKARFFNAFPNLDIAMLEQGWFVAHINVADLYGSPEAMRRFTLLYDFLTKSYNFSKKLTLEGFSRGGLAVFNWACQNPDKVSSIYADNPVCDIKSWPGGFKSCPRSDMDWEKCLKAYRFTEEQALRYDQNPVDNVDVLLKNNLPVIIVYGDADEELPIAENTLLMLKESKQIKAICKTGGLHHPHGLEDPKQIVDFIKSAYEQ